MGAVERKIILETEHIVVVEQDFLTPTVFVTFNELGMTANGRDYWGSQFFEKNELSAIGIITRAGNWYPEEDMKKAVPAILSSVRSRRVVTYGHSQGGYGALKYSRALGAAAVLSFSPQWSINPDDVEKFDGRFISYFRPELRNGLRIEEDDISNHSYIFYDPHQDQDKYHAKNLRKLSNIYPVLVPFSNHATVRFVTQGEVAKDLITLLTLKDLPSTQTLRNIFRATRRCSGMYHSEKIRFLANRLPRRLNDFLAELSYLPEKQRVIYDIIAFAYKQDFESAKPLLDLIDCDDIRIFPPLKLWSLFKETGFFDGEIKIARLYESMFPEMPFIRLHSVYTFIRAGFLDEANSGLDDVMKLRDSLEYINHIMLYSFDLRRGDIFERLLSIEEIPKEKRIYIYFYLIEMYFRASDRARATHYLDELEPLCSDSTDNILRISNYRHHIGAEDVPAPAGSEAA